MKPWTPTRLNGSKPSQQWQTEFSPTPNSYSESRWICAFTQSGGIFTAKSNACNAVFEIRRCD